MRNKILKFSADVLKKEILIKFGILFNKCFNAPYSITCYVTNMCNAHCAICNKWKNTKDPEELSIEDWKDLVKDLHDWPTMCSVAFTGGEPFVKNDFCELLNYTNNLGFYSIISTNGTFFNKLNCDKVLDTGVDLIVFSLFSVTPKVHNSIKGIPHVHEQIVEAIRYIKSKNKKVSIGVVFVINSDNYTMINEFLDWAYFELKIDSINFEPIRDTIMADFGVDVPKIASKKNTFWQIKDLKKFDKHIDLLIDKKNKHYPIATPMKDLKLLKQYFRDPSLIPLRSGCSVGFKNLLILPNGDVKLCHYFSSIGNIKKQNIKDIWFSKKADEQRREIYSCKNPCIAGVLREFTFLEKVQQFYIRSGFMQVYKKFSKKLDYSQ